MKRYIVLLMCLPCLIYDCSKPTILPHVETVPAELLVKETWSGPTTNGQSFEFSYNVNNLVSKIEWDQWGSFSYNGGPEQHWYDTTYSALEYSSGLVSKYIPRTNVATNYYGYEYNNKGLPVKRTFYTTAYIGDSAHPIMGNNTPLTFDLYKYDVKGNLMEMTDSSTNHVNFTYIFSYNDSNNLASCVDYIFGQSPTPVQKMKYEWTNFDTKINFIKAINGLPVTFVWDNYYQAYSSSAPNNFTSENYYGLVNINQPFGLAYTSSYSYEYDGAGFPIKMYCAPWIVTYQYKKI